MNTCLSMPAVNLHAHFLYPTQEKHEIDYTSYVNPFIGTDFTGNTYPGAQAPSAWCNLARTTDSMDGTVSPVISIRTVRLPVSATHIFPALERDLYDISFMPVTLPYKRSGSPLGIHSKFSHKDESAHAGYYHTPD